MPEHLDDRSSGLPETSESEEMYLLTVAVAEEAGHDGPLGLSALAGTLGVSAASANEMIRKLGDRELVDYLPYHGVRLTDAGRQVARQVLRTRRLWVAFLADHLGLSPRGADDLACQLEHVTPPEAVARLAEFLGHPEVDPLGRTIPSGDERPAVEPVEPLTSATAGTDVEVVSIGSDDAATAFLRLEGVDIGAAVHVVATGPRTVLLDTEDGRVHLDADVARSVSVRPLR